MNEKFNGGITLKIGEYTLKRLSQYKPSYDYEKDSFPMYNGTVCEKLKGIRYRASVTTGIMDDKEINELKTALSGHKVHFTAPDFDGDVYIQSVGKPLEVANDGRKYYRMTFAVSAVALTGGSGCL